MLLRHVYDPLEGLDDCGLTEEVEGRENILPEHPHRWLDAGNVSLEMPNGSIWPMFELSRGEYTADLSYYGIEAVYGGVYRFSAEGDVFPAFDVQLALPEELVLTAPEQGAPLEGPLALQWTGSSDGVLEIEVHVYPSSAFTGPFTLTCTLIDDGAYTIAAVPDAADISTVYWDLRRATVEEITLPSGELMGLVAEAAETVAP